MRLNSYPSSYALGHKALVSLFDGVVQVTEKVDGSQLSFAKYGGEYWLKSKGASLNLVAPEQMFVPAIEVIQTLDLHEGWVYRAEYLRSPKHNALAYDRIPRNHLIVFDINIGLEDYLSYVDMKAEADRIGLETVPLIYEGTVADLTIFRSFLDRTSILGGQKIEGVVVKNYSVFGPDKKILIGKYVSEQFKEVHAKEWRIGNPNSGDIIQILQQKYHSQARWQKALQHLTEAGRIEQSPRDIGLLMKEVPEDVFRECADEIKEALFSWAWAKIRRGLSVGLPEWYKEHLLRLQFEENASENPVLEGDATRPA